MGVFRLDDDMGSRCRGGALSSGLLAFRLLGFEGLGIRLLGFTYSLHCSSFLGLPFRILNRDSVKPKEGTTMETIGSALGSTGRGLVLASPSRNSETRQEGGI